MLDKVAKAGTARVISSYYIHAPELAMKKMDRNPLPLAFVRGLLLGTVIFGPLALWNMSTKTSVWQDRREMIIAVEPTPAEWRTTDGHAEPLGVARPLDKAPEPIKPGLR